jgi:hypothetical protein
MQKRTYISIINGLFLALYFLFAPAAVNASRDAVAVENTQNSSDDDQDRTYLSELSLDVIIPSYAFDFGGDVIFEPFFAIEFLPETELSFARKTPSFPHSYFEKLFEHTIATNAP